MGVNWDVNKKMRPYTTLRSHGRVTWL